MASLYKKSIRILIADDHGIVRNGLRRILEDEEDLVVVGEASNGRECLQQAEENQADIILMDIAMPELNGIETTRIISKNNPSIRIIILSMHNSPEYIFRSFKAGATGYILKQSLGQDVIKAVRRVNSGKTYLSPNIIDVVIDDYIANRQKGNEESILERLSNREREILQLVAEGKSSKEIAGLLNISPKTVETYRSRMMGKLCLTNLTQLIRFAIKQGIISAE